MLKTKKCSKCKNTKDIKRFSKDKHSKDNLTTICKDCHKKYRETLQARIYTSQELNTLSKKCSFCKNKKLLKEFKKDTSRIGGLSSQCKSCINGKRKKTFLTSKQLGSLKKVCTHCKETKLYENFFIHPANTTGVYSKCKSCVSEINKIKRKTDPFFKLKRVSRDRTTKAFKAKKIKKNSPTEKLLGAKWNIVKSYIEKQFSSGMDWKNHGVNGWHIDHIVPLNNAKNEEELVGLCHYTNLQPLWAKDNLSKGSKIL